MTKIITSNTEETIEFGKDFAKKLRGGELISLVGDLGGGKTTFMKGLAKNLDIKENIASPTFVILKEYLGKIDKKPINLVHVDAYRMETVEDIKSVGLEDYFGHKDVVIVVEWAERIVKILPPVNWEIKFEFVDENTREITYGLID